MLDKSFWIRIWTCFSTPVRVKYRDVFHQDLHSRLTRVVIECLPYQAFIPRYDTAKTLFYLDPPYYNCEDYYGKDLFHRDDFATLSELLGEIQGRFILSLNDVPEVRALFKSFKIETVKTRYSVQKGKQKEAGEVLISNG